MFPSAATKQLDPEAPERRQSKNRFAEAPPYKAFDLSSVIILTQKSTQGSITTEVDELEKAGTKELGTKSEAARSPSSLVESDPQWANKGS